MTPIIEEIVAALLLSGSEDLQAIQKYARWVKIRRMVNDRFYFAAHWVTKKRQPHWIGK